MKKSKKRHAFIFTLDALLVLPLIILIISSLISFSSTLKENVLLHEYSYMIAKDSINYLSELEMGNASIDISLEAGEETLPVLGYVAKYLSNTATTSKVIRGALPATKIPAFAGYIFEYKDTSGNWTEIASGGNLARLAPGNYSFQVSIIKIVSGLSDPVITQNPCLPTITCQIPHSIYQKGEIIGPVMFRIRVFV